MKNLSNPLFHASPIQPAKYGFIQNAISGHVRLYFFAVILVSYLTGHYSAIGNT